MICHLKQTVANCLWFDLVSETLTGNGKDKHLGTEIYPERVFMLVHDEWRGTSTRETLLEEWDGGIGTHEDASGGVRTQFLCFTKQAIIEARCLKKNQV